MNKFGGRKVWIPGIGAAVAGAYFGRKNVNAKKTGKKSKTSTRTKYNKSKVNSNYNNPGYSKKTKPKRAKKVSQVAKLAKQVKTLNKRSESDLGVLTFRQRTTGRVIANVNSSSYGDLNILTTTYYESVLAQLRYYDPSAPSTLVNADGATGSFMKDFSFTKNYCKLSVRNNYQVPCRITVYNCNVKEDTSISPYTAYTQGLADVGNPTATSTLVYLSDSPQFKDLWKIVATKKCVMQPGEEIVITHSAKPFQYDPSLVDSHSLINQSKYGCFGYVIRIEGILAHDTSADEQGHSAAGVDWSLDRTSIVEYSAGADIEYIYVNDASDSFTNSAVASSKPVADNQAYSVA